MIPIVRERSWSCGKYLVRQAVRQDNPAWPRYIILRPDNRARALDPWKIVGQSFSVPDEGWCEAIERITRLGRYVEKLSDLKKITYKLRGVALGRPTKAEQRRRMAEALTVPAE